MNPPTALPSDAAPRILEIQGMVCGGESERHTVRLACGLTRERGWPVWCLGPFGRSPSLAATLDAAGVPHIDADLATLADLWNNVQLARRLINEHGIQVVHSHLRNADIVAALATWQTTARWVTTLHGRTRLAVGSDLRRHMLWQLYRGFLTTRASAVMAVAGTVKQHYTAELGLPSEAVQVVPAGLDVTPLTDAARVQEVRRAVGVPGDATMILWADPFSAPNRPDEVVRLARRLTGSPHESHVVTIGAGPQCAAVQRAVESSGLGLRVHRSARRVDVSDLLGACDIALVTAHGETAVRVVMATAAHGVPCIVHATSAPAELVVDGATGFVVEPDDWGQLVQATMMLADEPERRRMMGEAALSRYRRRYTLDRFVAQTSHVLGGVLAAPAEPAVA